jgi:hypothetical protein
MIVIDGREMRAENDGNQQAVDSRQQRGDSGQLAFYA